MPLNQSMNVFDRSTKLAQRDRAAKAINFSDYDYLREEVADRIADRSFDIKRFFPVAVDLGCGRGYIGKYLDKEVIGTLVQCDHSKESLKIAQMRAASFEVPAISVIADEEFIPFPDHSVDLLFSSLSLHWVNDLPGTFAQAIKYIIIDNDGAFIGAMFGGDTLYELRCSLQLAEIERKGGFAPRVSPFADVRDVGNLLTRAGYTLTTIDLDDIIVNYPSMFELLDDLKGMGESNAAWSRTNILHRDTMMAAASIYKAMYGNDDGSVPATFRVISWIAWKPDKSQTQPAERGSATISMKDLSASDSRKGS
ncbi:uncharacterized protein TRIADDRAFT_18584 [Trichoplax adhaerens]|uniref:Arginine-hydroxylase NDUFAF5, mitochondrial n=1 Tax=Trichoplax adhaerens TaxID=10228 RepID=B3RKW3_TRIAD|nr:hypothetical protein TRIADDRAFT_18584 [Trichoplax adhaerens]EDV28657.1 hypothetical protein TRIADDRAFT_18584 [Trichoplax adhaerens]|eukprot:XP_002107859.1 hypothetical protein TRIADDRAFT_18584 [Trichoplax adhaerens]